MQSKTRHLTSRSVSDHNGDPVPARPLEPPHLCRGHQADVPPAVHQQPQHPREWNVVGERGQRRRRHVRPCGKGPGKMVIQVEDVSVSVAFYVWDGQIKYAFDFIRTFSIP